MELIFGVLSGLLDIDNACIITYYCGGFNLILNRQNKGIF